MSARRSNSISVDDQEDFEEFKKKKELKKQRQFEEVQKKNEPVTLMNMALFPVEIVVQGLDELMEILGPVGYAEFKHLVGTYSKDKGASMIKPYDTGMKGYVLVLNGDTVLSPLKHINPVSPFGCIAYHPILITETRMSLKRRNDIESVIGEYARTLYSAEKPSLATWIDMSTKVARDNKRWSEFLPNTNASIGLYQNSDKTGYVLMVNSHLGNGVVEELSRLIETEKLTAEQFGMHSIPQYLKELSSRNVSRIMAHVITILRERSLIINPDVTGHDPDATVEENEWHPARLEPLGSLTYNDFAWFGVTKKLCFFYNLSGGYTMPYASMSMSHQILMGPYKRGFKVFDEANRFSRSRAEEHIHGHPISTGVSETRKLSLKSNRVISVSGKVASDLNPFESDRSYLQRLYHDNARFATKENIVKTYSTIFVFIP